MEPGKCVAMTLHEQILEASADLAAARKDGKADWIVKAIRRLDDLLDEYSKEGKSSA